MLEKDNKDPALLLPSFSPSAIHGALFCVRGKRGKELNDCPRLRSRSLAGSPVIPDSPCCEFFQTRLLPNLGKHFQNARQNPDSQIFIWFWMICKLSIFRIILNCLSGHKYLDYTFCRSLLIATSRNSLREIVCAYYLLFHTFKIFKYFIWLITWSESIINSMWERSFRNRAESYTYQWQKSHFYSCIRSKFLCYYTSN